MQPGDIVKYSRPEPGEESVRFEVVEDNGNRILVRLICNLPIRPTKVLPADELEPAAIDS